MRAAGAGALSLLVLGSCPMMPQASFYAWKKAVGDTSLWPATAMYRHGYPKVFITQASLGTGGEVAIESTPDISRSLFPQ